MNDPTDDTFHTWVSPKHTSIPFDETFPGLLCAISINPKSDTGALNPFSWITTQYNYLRSIATGVELYLFPEFADASAKCHLHGYLRIHNPFEYAYFIRKLSEYGTFCIKHIFEPDTWAEYCLKQAHIWAPQFKLHNGLYNYPMHIVLDGTNLYSHIYNKGIRAQAKFNRK